MLASDLIAELQDTIAKHGDVTVAALDLDSLNIIGVDGVTFDDDAGDSFDDGRVAWLMLA